MIRIDSGDNEKHFYLCTTADWTAVVLATDFQSAAKTALQELFEKCTEGANLGPCIRVKLIGEYFEDHDELVRMDATLADMGRHKMASTMKKIISNRQKK